MEPKISSVVEGYIKLRDTKAALKAQYEVSIAPINEKLEKLEAYLLTESEKLGVSSFKTPLGTAYKSSRVSATVAAWDDLKTWVVNNDAWHFLERRVSKSAVEEYRKEHDGAVPPGVDVSITNTFNVRRN